MTQTIQAGVPTELELREDEAVCPVTHLTYLKGTTNPHIDKEGKPL